MIPETLKTYVKDWLKTTYQAGLIAIVPVGGAGINHVVKLKTTKADFFLKYNDRYAYPLMFETEKKGLALLSGKGLKVPDVYWQSETGKWSFLIIEWLETGTRIKNYWEDFGRGMALLHQSTQNYFGLDYNNYIGSLPQSNTKHKNWSEFFIKQRLEAQIELATTKNLMPPDIRRNFEKLYPKLSGIFPEEKPALLHGDLWSGNFITDRKGRAAIIDPAVYFGHREMDLAMSRLFGGFDPVFYRAYHEAFPLLPGYNLRVDICNLYPLLVHLNLFGTTYLKSIKEILKHIV